jgi:hypothetical protein
MGTYRTIHAMSLPMLDEDGKPLASGKERLVMANTDVELDGELAERALQQNTVRELTEDERKAAEPEEAREGDEVNAGSESAKAAEQQRASLRAKAEAEGTPLTDRPVDDAPYADWVAYAKQEGVSASGKKEDIIARVNEKEAAKASGN